jgi:hypothetical protein
MNFRRCGTLLQYFTHVYVFPSATIANPIYIVQQTM